MLREPSPRAKLGQMCLTSLALMWIVMGSACMGPSGAKHPDSESARGLAALSTLSRKAHGYRCWRALGSGIRVEPSDAKHAVPGSVRGLAMLNAPSRKAHGHRRSNARGHGDGRTATFRRTSHPAFGLVPARAPRPPVGLGMLLVVAPLVLVHRAVDGLDELLDRMAPGSKGILPHRGT